MSSVFMVMVLVIAVLAVAGFSSNLRVHSRLTH